MKKLLLMFSAGLVSTGAMAQSAHKAALTTPHAAKLSATVMPEGAATIKTTATSATANKTSGARSRWYNHSIAAAAYNVSGNTPNADNLDSVAYYGSLAGLIDMWPDSTVHYPSPDDAYGITYLTIAEAFQPQGAEYNSADLYPNEVAAGNVIDTEAYNIDSISVLGFYTRVDPTLVDTLIFTMTYEDTTFKYPFASYDATVLASHGVDSFVEILWRTADYGVNPLNQTRYTYGGLSYCNALQVKVPLNDATVNDTITDGMLAGFMRFSIAPHVAIKSGNMGSVSVAYKPSSLGSYPNGSTIDQYNHFSFLSHKPDTLGGFAQYMPNDFNMSYIVPKDTTFSNVNASLAIFIPTIGFTSAQFFPEEHDISFKASWTTVGIGNTPKNVANVSAYPNPAVTVLNIPVTMAQASAVSVTLTNTAGQVVMTQDLGTVSGGTTKTASFGISPLASGVYFYTVNAGGQTITNRVTVAH